MSLHVILGFETLQRKSPAMALYVGYDGDAALAARDRSTSARTEWIRDPQGIRKVNPQLAEEKTKAANLAAAEQARANQSAPVIVEKTDLELRLEKKVERLEAELSAAKEAAEDTSTPEDEPQTEVPTDPDTSTEKSGETEPKPASQETTKTDSTKDGASSDSGNDSGSTTSEAQPAKPAMAGVLKKDKSAKSKPDSKGKAKLP